MQANFEYSDKEHIYKLNGRILPSCTQILQEEGIANYDFCDDSDKQWGKAGHKMTELWDKNTINMKTISPDLFPYLIGYQKFLADFKVIILPEWIECPTYSQEWGYGVTPDRVVNIRGKMTIYEIKFSAALSRSTAIQTAAQKLAVEEHTSFKIKQRIGLRLMPNSYKLDFYDKITDERIWISAAILNKFKKEQL